MASSYNKSTINELMPERINTGWPWRFLILGILSLGLTIALYVGLTFGYTPTLNSEIRKLKSDLLSLGEKITESERESFLNFYSQFANLKALLEKHSGTSKVFAILEENTNENIYFTSVALDLKSNELSVRGVASSYEDLARQGLAFEKIEKVERFSVEDVQLSAKGIGFKLRILFESGFFTIK
jgi:hypothetical protein